LVSCTKKNLATLSATHETKRKRVFISWRNGAFVSASSHDIKNIHFLINGKAETEAGSKQNKTKQKFSKNRRTNCPKNA
jgi:hypothetical protein